MSSSASVPLVNGGVPFASQTRKPATSIITDNLPAPVAQYVGTDALLRVTFRSVVQGANLIVRTRLLRSDDGVITSSEDLIQTDNSGTLVIKTIGLTEGFLLSCEITCDSFNLARGMIFVSVELCHGNPVQLHRDLLLIQDYIATGYATSWPGGTPTLSTTGPGAIQSTSSPGAGAGNDFNISFQFGLRLRFAGITLTLTTSAAVANRVPTFQFQVVAGTVYQVTVAAPIPASTVAHINLGAGIGAPSVNSNNHLLPIPENLILAPTPIFASSTAALQPGDNYSAINAIWEQWVDS